MLYTRFDNNSMKSADIPILKEKIGNNLINQLTFQSNLISDASSYIHENGPHLIYTLDKLKQSKHRVRNL